MTAEHPKASIKETYNWFDFVRRCVGYSFFSLEDNTKVPKYIVYETHKKSLDLMPIADGTNTSYYRRTNSIGYSNGVCTHYWASINGIPTFVKMKAEDQLKMF